MTTLFFNYIQEGVQNIGQQEQRRNVETEDSSENVQNNDMLRLHLDLTRQLTRNQTKNYNKKSLFVVVFFTVVSYIFR